VVGRRGGGTRKQRVRSAKTVNKRGRRKLTRIKEKDALGCKNCGNAVERKLEERWEKG